MRTTLAAALLISALSPAGLGSGQIREGQIPANQALETRLLEDENAGAKLSRLADATRKALIAQDWPAACRLARQGRALDPTTTLWWRLQELRATSRLRVPHTVVRLANDALRAKPRAQDRLRVLLMRAAAFEELESDIEALGDYSAALRVDKEHSFARRGAHAIVAKLLDAMRRDTALSAIRKQLRDKPADPQIRHTLGLLLLEGDSKSAGLAELEAAARAYRKRGDLARASETWLSIASANSEDARARNEALRACRACLERLVSAGDSNEVVAHLQADLRRLTKSGSQATPPTSLRAPRPPSDPTVTTTAELFEVFAKLAAERERATSQRAALEQHVGGCAKVLDTSLDRARLQQQRGILKKLAQDIDAPEAERASLDKRLDMLADAWQKLNRRIAGKEAKGERFATLYSRILSERQELTSLLSIRRAVRTLRDRIPLRLAACEIRTLFLAGDYRSSAREAGAILEAGEHCAAELAMHGLANYELREHDRAVVSLHASLGEDPAHVDAGRVRAALRALRAQAGAERALVEELRTLGRHEEAVQSARALVQLAPFDAANWTQLGYSLWALEARADALRALRTAIALAPDKLELRRARMGMAEQMRDLPLLLFDAEHWARIDSENADAQLAYARALELCGHADRAQDARAEVRRITASSFRADKPLWTDVRAKNLWFARKTRYVASSSAEDLWTRLPWRPQATVHMATKQRLFAFVQGGISEAEALEVPTHASPKLAKAWPALAGLVIADHFEILARREKDKTRAEAMRRARSARLEAIFADAQAPLELVAIAARRLGRALPSEAFRWNAQIAIRVPQDIASVDHALAIAKPGQSIELARGRFASRLHIKRSVRIVGHGPSSVLEYRPHPRFTSGSLHASTYPLLELEGLRLDRASAREAWRFTCARGVLRMRSCDLGPTCQIVILRGAEFEATGVRALGGLSVPVLEMRGGHLLAWRSAFDRKLRLAHFGYAAGKKAPSNDPERFAQLRDVHLNASVECVGQRSTLHMEHVTCTLRSGDSAALLLRNGAWAHVDQIRAFASALVPQAALLDVADRASAERLVMRNMHLLGRVTLHATTESAAFMQGQAEAERSVFGDNEPLGPARTVKTAEELRDAIAQGSRHLVLARGRYELSALPIERLHVLRAASEGVFLSPKRRARRPIFELRGGSLELHGVCFITRGEQQPHVRGRGQLAMLDCADAGVLHETPKIDLRGAALWVDAYQRGPVLELRGGSKAVLANASARALRVVDSDAIVAGDAAGLRSVQVDGREARVRFAYAQPERLHACGFSRGARDPRVSAQRERDGASLAVRQTELLRKLKRSSIDPVLAKGSSASDSDWDRELSFYYGRLFPAFRMTMRDPRRIGQAVAARIHPWIQGRPRRLLSISRRWTNRADERAAWQNIKSRLSKQQQDFFRARAAAELSTKNASEAELVDATRWQMAISAGRRSKAQREEAERRQLSFAGYERHLAQRAAARKRKRAAAERAIATGDPAKIRRALGVLGRDEYAKFLLRDERASIHELRRVSKQFIDYGLLLKIRKKLARMEAAQARAPQSRFRRSFGRRTRSSSSASPGFQTWLRQSRTWNRRMDRYLKTFKSSQFNSFQNRYR